ncbi:protein-disulfide reductase DsbD domain-containing protein [Mucilaginibacter sp. OK098]|uniref:protein-disulfide reductase DsbD domain-containing protein n=1 Tax=Mucilaginibacter sp. OK098 TaxID=1855297 RepID=UPI000915CA18|nr:protein-disulfide reductase DsbD domain-containing protein [Mucilaginibacter sp. OK098]SHN36348.1 Disulphide bond corrector protein DsbC [Mucilaginibacter sp. OK098]
MKKIILIALAFIIHTTVFPQILAPVKWSYGTKRISDTEAIIFIKASIDKGWHIYSQHVDDGGPVKTTITFAADNAYVLNGITIEPKPVSKYEKTFSMNVAYFEKAVVFQQKVKLKAGQASVNGTINYMACDDHQCLPPENVEFAVALK